MHDDEKPESVYGYCPLFFKCYVNQYDDNKKMRKSAAT